VQYEKRSFSCDLLRGERCGGRARIIAAITQRSAIDKILAHLGLATKRLSVPASPRAPPFTQLALDIPSA